MTKKTEKKSVVYVSGESPMVETYADLCAEKGYEVFVSWNKEPVDRPKGASPIKKSSGGPPPSTVIAIELTNTDGDQKRKNIERIDKALSPTAPILSSSVTITATEQSSWVKHKHRLVGICALPSLIEAPTVEVAPTIHSPKETIDVVLRFYQSLGKEAEIVQDRIGMVVPRILCQLINESAFALMEEVASPLDIDTAMKLGVNYPNGPIEWAEKIGLSQVYAVLSALESDLREDRYRIAPLLRQMSVTGEWWKTKTQTKDHS
ncbi:MAG: 3-hydroxyacyl-CoA dehydrogenase family protein [Bacteroidota bacterium]